ncbi:hypothetical protein, partial [Staphylococcus aureus]
NTVVVIFNTYSLSKVVTHKPQKQEGGQGETKTNNDCRRQTSLKTVRKISEEKGGRRKVKKKGRKKG